MESQDHKLEYRALVKHFTKKGWEPKEIYNELINVHGEDFVSKSTITYWWKHFKTGHESIKDEPRSGRSKIATTEENIAIAQELVSKDPRISIDIISTKLQVSHGIAWHIIHEVLEMKWVNEKLVPKMLRGLEKQFRFQHAKSILKEWGERWNHLAARLVTCDETWIYHTPSQGKVWVSRGDQPPKKPRIRNKHNKVLATIFWDTKGVLLIDYMPQGKTLTGEYYTNLLEKLYIQLKEKRKGMISKGILLLHDNAPIHKSEVSKKKLQQLKIKELPHPPYSPDLAPSDFFLFPNLKNYIRKKEFSNEEEVKVIVNDYFQSKNETFFSNGINSLKSRLEECVKLNGDFVL